MNSIDVQFQQLYEKYYGYIYRFLLKWTNGNAFITEELTQETFYQVFLSLHRYRGECSVKTWICRIGINVACKYFDKNPQYMEINESLSVESKQNVEEIIIYNEDLNRLREAVRKLQNKYKDVVMYRIYFELSFEEISRIMNISQSSAKVLYHRAKEQLRELMK